MSEITFLIGLLSIMLLVLYVQGAFSHHIQYRVLDIPKFKDWSFIPTLIGFSKALLAQTDSIQFWSHPDEIYAARLAAIRAAQYTIHFETFYMTPGVRADEFAAALGEQAAKGVSVQCLVDALGTRSIPQQYWQRLKRSGVEVRFFHPFNWKAPLQYFNRTHRKLLIVDGTVVLIGGTGVSDFWDGFRKGKRTFPWLDCEIQVTGWIAQVLEGLFIQHWLYVGGMAVRSPFPVINSSAKSLQMLITASEAEAKVSPIMTLVWMSILAAQSRVWMASPYFLMDRNARRALIEVSKKGVEVAILTTGKVNDKPLIYYAVREQYYSFLKADIKIYEYKPSMMHAKMMLMDRDWASIGSANFDPRSFFHNDELNFSFFESELIQQVEHCFQDAFLASGQVTLKDWRSRPWWQKVLGQITLLFRWQL
jgi:cardiolipin synthase A/B